MWNKCEDIADLDNLTRELEEETEFESGVIQVFQDDEGTYAIEVNGKDYSTYISIEEAESELRSIFFGIHWQVKGDTT